MALSDGMVPIETAPVPVAAPAPHLARTRIWGFGDVALICGVSLVLTLLGAVFVVVTSAFITIPDAVLTIAVSLIEFFALILSFTFLGQLRKGLNGRAVGLHLPQAKWLLLAVGIAVLCIPLRALIVYAVEAISGNALAVSEDRIDLLAPTGTTFLQGLGMLLVVGLLVPVAEELIFRGVLYRYLRGHWPVWAAVLVSSVIFGIAHGDVLTGISSALLGAVLALTFEYSDSLWTSIVVHIVNNSISMILILIYLAMGQVPATI